MCIKNEEFCIKIDACCRLFEFFANRPSAGLIYLVMGPGEELNIKNDEFCTKDDEFCTKNDGLCTKNDEFCITKVGTVWSPGFAD